MYIPKDFQITDMKIIDQIIKDNPLAIIISCTNGVIDISHIPIFKYHDTYYGHLSKSNPQNLDDKVSLVFTGNSGYISANFYTKENFNVPTYNYITVKIDANIEFINDKNRAFEVLQEQVKHFESDMQIPWKLAKDDIYKQYAQGIKVFEIQVVNIEAKAKLSQNKKPQDIQSAISNVTNEGLKQDMKNFNA